MNADVEPEAMEEPCRDLCDKSDLDGTEPVIRGEPGTPPFLCALPDLTSGCAGKPFRNGLWPRSARNAIGNAQQPQLAIIHACHGLNEICGSKSLWDPQ